VPQKISKGEPLRITELGIFYRPDGFPCHRAKASKHCCSRHKFVVVDVHLFSAVSIDKLLVRLDAWLCVNWVYETLLAFGKCAAAEANGLMSLWECNCCKQVYELNNL